MMLHNLLGPISTMVNVHFGAALPNYACLEDNRSALNADKFDWEIFSGQARRAGPYYPLPTAPGLGIEFNEERADQPFRFYEQPHLHRKDGSKTNW